MLEILIRDGTIIDGTGRPRKTGDIGICGDRIVMVGPLDSRSARETIDARGLIVAPGFIDTHTHSDLELLVNPEGESSLLQGVTTEIIGQDGLSYAPLSPEKLELYCWYLSGLNGEPPRVLDWSSVGEFRAKFDGTVGVNTAFLIPHGAVRLEVANMKDTPLDEAQMAKALRLIGRGMEEGAIGLSTGLSYYPCAFADTEELVELCRTVRDRNGVFAIHLRSVAQEQPDDPIQEALEIGRRSGVAVHLSHFKTTPSNAGQWKQLVQPLVAARSRGVDVSLELYAYPSGCSVGLIFLPSWAHEGGPKRILRYLTTSATRERIINDIPTYRSGDRVEDWSEYRFSYLPSDRNKHLVGLSFDDAAKIRNTTPEALICDLLVEENLRVGWLGNPPEEPGIEEALENDLLNLLSLSNCMVGSDAIHVGQRPHPRAYGNFAKVLRLVRENASILSLETLVNRITALPAERFGLRDRGVISPGKAADLVIFDPGSVTETATYDNPKSPPIGVMHVLVNGKVAVRDRELTEALAGRAIPV